MIHAAEPAGSDHRREILNTGKGKTVTSVKTSRKQLCAMYTGYLGHVLKGLLLLLLCSDISCKWQVAAR